MEENNKRLKKIYQFFIEQATEKMSFLKDLGYDEFQVKKSQSELIGSSVSIEFIHKKVDRSLLISVNFGSYNLSKKVVSIFILKNILNNNRDSINDYIELERLCNYENIQIETIKDIRSQDIEIQDMIKTLLDEFANLLQNNFLNYLEGKVWMNGLYPDK